MTRRLPSLVPCSHSPARRDSASRARPEPARRCEADGPQGAHDLAPQRAAHYNLAQLYDQTNEAARAVEHYRRFLEIAGAGPAGRAASVRARIAELSRTPE